MTQTAEGKVIKISWANLWIMVAMFGACFKYVNDAKNEILTKLNEVDKKGAVIQNVNECVSGEVRELKSWRSTLSTYYDKPKGIKIVIQNN